ncbi:hypothetical protein [Variovorax sp. PAMC26660]|jgi:hypothetical protein|uniref:hypothetical protein n=1 Tax=Variovorax sp. PAMC26660 TaxID=2762322 RepID=UPI00164D9D1A|nr:hypothetical protein [Variovorax sp. PAMC26660]QNK70106.1 hypothetical protein H7F35_10660 [Variovorax sp. PAMC26660]
MNFEASSRALSYLQQIHLLTDAEHAAAADDPERVNAPLRTPAEALAWVVAREIVSQQQLAGLPARAAAGRENEAQAIVSEATGLISGDFPLPAWALLHMSLLERRLQDGVSAEALDQLLAMQLIDAAQHAHSLSMLPTHQEAWAAPDSLPATLAWTVLGSGALSEDNLKALAGRAQHADLVADAIARIAGAPTVTRTTSKSTSFSTSTLSFTTTSSSSASPLSPVSSSQTRTQAWTSTRTSTPTPTPGLVPNRWKLIGFAVVALIALYLLFGR